MVVAEGPVDLVADQEDAPLRQNSARARISSAVATMPVGFTGELTTTHLVRVGQDGRDPGGIDAEVGIGVNQHRDAARQRRQVAVHHEIGIEDDHLVTWVDDAAKRQQQPARRAGGDEDLAVAVAELGVDRGLELAAQLGDALGDGIGVVPLSIAAIAASLTGPGTSKSGRPIERLIGSFIDFAMSNALRMPEASMCFILSAIQASFTGCSLAWRAVATG